MCDSEQDMLAENLLAVSRMTFSRLPDRPRLTRTQWMVLRYFAQANEASCTSSAFSRYYGSTAGSVSATIEILVRRGLLERRPAEEDRRSVRLGLTAKARDLLEEDPALALEQSLEALTASQRTTLDDCINELLDRLALQLKRPRCGRCRLCAHLVRAESGDGARSTVTCSRFDKSLGDEELDLMCIEYEALSAD